MDQGSREQEHLQLLCFILFFFFPCFFFFFSKNVTMKIPKIKPLPEPQPLLPQAPPPKCGPVGWVGGGGERGKKEKRKKPHFSVFFFLRRPKSL